MSWNVYFRMVRDTPLEPEELDALARQSRAIHRNLHDYDLVIAVTPDGDSTVAHGHVERYYDPDDAEVRQLLDAISQLRGLVPNAKVEVWDDFELIGWNGSTGAFDFMGQCDVPRFSLPAMSASRRKVSDLPDDHEFGPDAWATRPIEVPRTPLKPGQEQTISLPEPPSFRVLADGWRRRLSLQCWLHNPHGVLAELQQIELVLRDAAGAAVDVVNMGIHQPVAELQYVSGRQELSPGSLQHARQVDVVAEYSYEVRQPIARLSIDPLQPPLDESWRLPVTVSAQELAPGPLPFELRLRAWHGHQYEGFVQLLVSMTPSFIPGDLSAHLRMLLRDEAGMALGAAEQRIEFPTDGSEAVVPISVDIPRARMGQVRHLEVDLEATRRVHARLGRYALDLPR